MKKRYKNYLLLFFVLTLSFSFGYAYLNSSLYINGTSIISANVWEVGLDNLNVTAGSVAAIEEPTVNNTETAFSVKLTNQDDFYEFTVDVVNNGDVDAKLGNLVETTGLTSEQEQYFDYTLSYQNNEPIQVNQLVKKDEFVRLKSKVEYKEEVNITSVPESAKTLNLGFKLNYNLDDGTGIEVKNNGKEKIKPIANDSLDKIGTIVTIGTENFYTFGEEGDNVKLLAMGNLYVGYTVDRNLNVTPIENPTGMQSNKSIGYGGDRFYSTSIFPYVGTTEFSNEKHHGEKYSDYNGSVVEGYVNEYKRKLETLYDVNIIESRLITKMELEDIFGCDDAESECIGTKVPEWLCSTTYWASANGDNYVATVDIENSYTTNKYNENTTFGVRPVIVIPKNDIIFNVKPIADGNINDIGTVVTIGSEQFYTLGVEENNVKLLSKYNLYVGGQKVNGNWTKFEKTTGLQSGQSNGFFSGENGITNFSSNEIRGTNYSDYKGSIVEGYVNDYKTKLEELYNIQVKDARLITKDELLNNSDLSCVSSGDCNNLYKWIFDISYWTGSASNNNSIYVMSSKKLNTAYYNSSNYGVRPVIIISKDYFK